MNKIRDRLFLGGQGSLHLDQLEAHRITAILNVADNYDAPEHVRLRYPCCKVELRDGGIQNHLTQYGAAVFLLQYLLDCGETVLIHCAGGRNRSPSVVAEYLCQTEGGTFEERWQELRRLRPVVQERSAIVGALG